MPDKFIPFTPWRPDRSEFNTEGVETVANVIRTANGYRPFPGLTPLNAQSAALPAGRPVGMAGGKTRTGIGEQWSFVEGRAPLALNPDAAGWTEENQSPLNDPIWTLSTENTDNNNRHRVKATQWEDYLFVTNFWDNLRKRQLGEPPETFIQVPYQTENYQGAWVSGTVYEIDQEVFYNDIMWQAVQQTASPTTPPAEGADWTDNSQYIKCRDLAVVRDFLVMGNFDDPDFTVAGIPRGGVHPDRVRWSALGDPFSISLEGDAATSSDFQDIPDAGAFQGIVGGEYGVVLMENGIFRMDFVGPPSIFAFNRVENARGCVEPNSIVTARNVTYYLSDDGWKSFDGQTVKSVGAERFDRWFTGAADQSSLDTMSAFVDPRNQLIVWGFHGGISSKDVNDTALLLNYELNEPSVAYFDHSILGQFALSGYDLEDLDVFGTLEQLPASMDDALYRGGSQNLGALVTTNEIRDQDVQLYTFTGIPDPALIYTSEQRLGGLKRAKVQMVQTAIEGDAQTIRIRVCGRNRLGKARVCGIWRDITADGLYPVFGDARYQIVQTEITSDDLNAWRDATGVFITFTPTSIR
jgi:hypothetical protein